MPPYVKRAQRDRSVSYAVVAAVALLATGFGSAWFYQRHTAALHEQVVYSRPSRVVAATDNYSVAAGFAVSTSGSDARWAVDNRRRLEEAVRQALTEQDARVALRPDGLLALQERLREAGNAALQTDKIRAVVLTDFLLMSSDD